MSQPQLPGLRDIAEELCLSRSAVVAMVDSANLIVEGDLAIFDRLNALTNTLATLSLPLEPDGTGPQQSVSLGGATGAACAVLLPAPSVPTAGGQDTPGPEARGESGQLRRGQPGVGAEWEHQPLLLLQTRAALHDCKRDFVVGYTKVPP